MEHISEFLDYCAASGFRPERAGFKADGRLVNFLSNDEKKYSKYRGKLMLFPDGGAFGMVYDFSAGDNALEWHSRAKSGLSRDELRILAAQRDEARRVEELAIQRKQARFSERLTKLWKSMPEPQEIHPYAIKKKIAMGRTKTRGNGELLIPLYNASGSVTTLQRIPKSCDGKWMLSAASGAVVKGSYHPILGSTGTATMVICEGYATGQTINKALGVTVICAMTAGNLLPVAQVVRKKYPDAVIVFAADNDESETGWKRCNEAAAAIGGAAVFMPEKVGYDFNDAGEDESRRIIDLNSAAVFPVSAVEGGEVAQSDVITPDERDEAPPEYFDTAGMERDYEREFSGGGENKLNEGIKPYGLPLRVLGVSHDKYCYYSYRREQIIELAASQHNKLGLWQMATNAEWAKAYGVDEKGAPIPMKNAYERAVDDLMRIGNDNSPFIRSQKCRVFGAWKEDSGYVFNGGFSLRKGDRSISLRDNDSDYVYLRPEEDNTVDVRQKPLNSESVLMFLDLCGAFKWENPVMGDMLAGWTFIAPHCNVLPFRPHIFVTGETGSGKSWAVMNSAVRAIENSVLIAKMTEAKLREKTYNGIRPIIMDETGKGDKSAERDNVKIDQIISLARDASTGKGAVIEVSGKDPALIKFCACLIASNPPLKNLEDENRFFFLRLKQDTSPDAMEKFKALQDDVAAIFHEGFSDQFIMLGFSRLNIIIENAKVFKRCVQRISNARAADVIGMLCAGYWSLKFGAIATEEQATEYIAQHDWSSGAVVENKPEYITALEHILSYRLTEQSNSGKRDVTIGNLLLSAKEGDDLATRTLADVGIAYDFGKVYFATGAAYGAVKALKGTRWQDSCRTMLMRITGAENFAKYTFSKSVRTSGVLVPFSVVDGGE